MKVDPVLRCATLIDGTGHVLATNHRRAVRLSVPYRHATVSDAPKRERQCPMLLSASVNDQGKVDAGGLYVLGTCSDPTAPCGLVYSPYATMTKASISVE
jgi:hypothetical protein